LDPEVKMDAVVKVAGMTCQGCVRSVTRVLSELPGVESVQVSLEKGEAAVRYDPSRADEAGFRKAVADAGFEAA
jgi:copper chaperone CopZ